MKRTSLLLAGLLALSPRPALHASDWPMFAGNSQRTGVAVGESRITPRSARKLKLAWKAKLANTPKELNSLTVPIVATGIKGAPAKDYVIVAGSDDNVFALNARNGKLLWSRHFKLAAIPSQQPDWLCPNALTATPVLDSASKLLYTLSSDGQLYTMSLITGEDALPPRQMTPPFAKVWSLNLVNGILYTATSQACNTVRSAIYAMPAAGGAAQQFLAMRIYGAGIWGRAGVPVDPSGIVFAETGDGVFNPDKDQYPNAVLAVDTKSLQLRDYFTPTNYAEVSKKDLDMGNMTPSVFPYGNKELIAASGKEGRIYLLDAKDLGGADHMTPLLKSDLFANASGSYFAHGFWGAMSTWQDAQHARWLYASAWGPATETTHFRNTHGSAPSGSVMAFQVTGPDSAPRLEPVWQSVNMSVPEPVVIANCVVLALSDGDNVDQNDASGSRLLKSSFRASHPSGHAILYALDAVTGDVLYSSGETIPGFVHFSGLAVADGRVYVVTWDNTVYSFAVR